MTPGSGNGTVAEAANQFLSMMDEAEAPDEGQVEAQPEESEEGDLVEEEQSYEDTDDADEGEEEESQEDEPVYRLKMAGEEREISQSELIQLAQQGADYTKKSQQVAEARKRVEAESSVIEEARKEREEYSIRLQALQQYLEQTAPKAEDLDYLKENDPIGYAVKVAEMTQQEKQLSAVQAERQRIAEMQQADAVQKQRHHIAQQAELVSQLIPDYSDAQKGEALRKELRLYAKSIGYSDAEVNAVYDARTVKALYDAMQFSKLQKAKPEVTKKVSQAPKVLKPGVSQSKQNSNSEQIKRDKSQLKKTGRVKDAARLFEKFI